MGDFIKIFVINFVSDVDNILILGAILQRHPHLKLTIQTAVALTVMRTIYVSTAHLFTEVPGIHVLVGLLLLVIAFKIATKPIIEETEKEDRTSYNLLEKVKVLALLVGTDFLISLDGVIAISEVSKHIMPVMLGILTSLLISLHFLPYIIRTLQYFSLVNIIVGGFMAQTAILGIAKDHLLLDWINQIDQLFPKFNVVTLVANSMVIVVVLVGLILKMKRNPI